MGCSSSSGKSFRTSSQPSLTSRVDFAVRFQKASEDVLGAALGNTSTGAVILNVQEHGLLAAWNRANPDLTLYPGLIITEVNGVTGYFPMLEELDQPGELAIKITAIPPKNVGPKWAKEVAELGRNLEMPSGKNAFMLRLQPKDPSTTNPNFSSLPSVRAGDVGVEQCPICLEDVDDDDMLMHLPCKHAFHAQCAARWLTQTGMHGLGKHQFCPLCFRKVVSTPDGDICTADDAAQN